jgi:predicted GIY-YIG superfamily endonuclease
LSSAPARHRRHCSSIGDGFVRARRYAEIIVFFNMGDAKEATVDEMKLLAHEGKASTQQ